MTHLLILCVSIPVVIVVTVNLLCWISRKIK